MEKDTYDRKAAGKRIREKRRQLGITMKEAAEILAQLQDCLREHFPVSVPHTTFQLEPEGYSSTSKSEMHS